MLIESVSANISGNTVTNTAKVSNVPLPGGSSADIGDGISVFDGSTAVITNNANIGGNGRVGIIVDNAASITLKDNQVSGGECGIILQNNQSTATKDVGTNTVSGMSGEATHDYGAGPGLPVKKESFAMGNSP